MVKIDIFIQKRNVQKAFEFIIAPFSVRAISFMVSGILNELKLRNRHFDDGM